MIVSGWMRSLRVFGGGISWWLIVLLVFGFGSVWRFLIGMEEAGKVVSGIRIALATFLLTINGRRGLPD